jgi:hypothetical protein
MLREHADRWVLYLEEHPDHPVLFPQAPETEPVRKK